MLLEGEEEIGSANLIEFMSKHKDALRADVAEGDVMPFAVSRELLERGQQQYDIWCSVCHGEAGYGQSMVAERGGIVPANFHQERLVQAPIGHFFNVITNGVYRGDANNGGYQSMYGYASRVSAEDRWAIVAYVKSEQMKKDDTVEQEPGGIADVGPVLVADAKVGEALYKAKNCSACHSLDGNRVVGTTFKGIWGRKDSTDKGEVVVNLEYVKESIANPMAKIVTGYPPAMPPYVLTDLEEHAHVAMLDAVGTAHHGQEFAAGAQVQLGMRGRPWRRRPESPATFAVRDPFWGFCRSRLLPLCHALPSIQPCPVSGVETRFNFQYARFCNERKTCRVMPRGEHEWQTGSVVRCFRVSRWRHSVPPPCWRRMPRPVPANRATSSSLPVGVRKA